MANVALTHVEAIINEVSYDASERMRLLIELFSDDEQSGCRDPFDVIAEIEEALGQPLFFS